MPNKEQLDNLVYLASLEMDVTMQKCMDDILSKIGRLRWGDNYVLPEKVLHMVIEGAYLAGSTDGSEKCQDLQKRLLNLIAEGN